MAPWLHLNPLLHWYAPNFTVEFRRVIMLCNYKFIHIILRNNYARDTLVISRRKSVPYLRLYKISLFK
jgi:hypothetical protein